MVREVYVFGFASMPEGWPEDLKPVAPASWPPDRPVVVHLGGLAEFRQRLRDLERMPDAVLLVPAGASPPGEALAEFDEIVREGEWDRLRALLACPRRWAVSEWVYELPRDVLFGPDEAALGDERIPGEVREHLGQCETCRSAFIEALGARRRVARLFCPDVGRLAASLRGAADELIERHIRECPPCRAEWNVLKDRLMRKTITIADLPPVPAALAAAGPGEERVWAEAQAGPLRVRVTVGPDEAVWVRVETEDEALEGKGVRVWLGEEAVELRIRHRPGGLYDEALVGRVAHLRLGAEPQLIVEMQD